MRQPQGQKDELFRRIEALVRAVRRRRNLRLLLRGLVGTAGFSLAVFFVSSWAMDRLLYSDRAVLVIRSLSWVTVGSFFLYQLVLPFLRRTSDRQIALYIEEHEPELESALVTSLELGGVPAAGETLTNDLHRRLLADTIDRCERIDFGKGIERSALQRASGGLAMLAGLALVLTLLSPAFLRHGASLLLFPWNTAALDNPYRIVVSPTDVVVAKGADVAIIARLEGFAADNVRLVLRSGETTEWQRHDMIGGGKHDSVFGRFSDERGRNDLRGSGLYRDYEFLRIAPNESFEYFVEANGIRSVIAEVEMIDLPYTERIDLTYTFPKYAGLETEKIEDGGDIAALEGTSVEMSVLPTMPTDAVRIVVEGESPVDLVPSADGKWLHTFEVSGPGFYHLEMKDARGRFARASADYAIQHLGDLAPMVEFRTPGRDLKVNKIEEIFVEVSAQDDYGIATVDLEFSINGAEIQTKRLVTTRRGSARKVVTVGYTFFLEDYQLQDGDFISYYAKARDGRPGAGVRTESSDIYFLEIRPFSQNYRRADSGGGGEGGEGGADAALSKRQREIVAATFGLLRDRKKISNKEFSESVATVALSQTRVREQVVTLMSRMGNRSMLASNEDFGKILEHLESALAPMEKAAKELSDQKVETALLTEQEALAALQRAEAMFRDVRVSFDPSAGGSGGSGEIAEDLADLFELELEKLRNQYETVQRGQQQAEEQKIDELEERLRELARRQQKQNEREKRLGKRSSGGGQGGGQQDLVEDTEELARELERLSREQASPEMRKTAQALQRAVDQMKRSGSEGQASSGAAGEQAERALEEARRLLDKTRQSSVEEGVNQVSSRAQALSERQSQIREKLEQLSQSQQDREAGNVGSEGQRTGASRPNAEEWAELQQLLERKRQIQEQVTGLEDDLDRLARQSRREQPELARSLQQAANDLRASGVAKKIEYSMAVLGEGDVERGVLFEQAIAEDLDSLRDNVEEALEKLGTEASASAENSLEKTRELVEGLESLEQRLRDRVASVEEAQGRKEGGRSEGERGANEQGSEQGDSGAGQQRGGEEGAPEGSESREGEAGTTETGRQGGGTRTGSNQGQEGQQGEQGSNPTAGREGREGPQQGSQGSAEGANQGQREGGRPAMGSGSSAGQFQPGAFSEEDIRQMTREIQHRLAQTRELRQSLEQQGVDTADLRDIERSMRRFDTRKLVNEPLALEALRKNIEELRQFEFGLWRSLDGGSGTVHAPRTDRVPQGYEKQAERYFRALALRDGN